VYVREKVMLTLKSALVAFLTGVSPLILVVIAFTVLGPGITDPVPVFLAVLSIMAVVSYIAGRTCGLSSWRAIGRFTAIASVVAIISISVVAFLDSLSRQDISDVAVFVISQGLFFGVVLCTIPAFLATSLVILRSRRKGKAIDLATQVGATFKLCATCKTRLPLEARFCDSCGAGQER